MRIAFQAGVPGFPLIVDRREIKSLKREDLKKAEVYWAGSRLLIDKMLVDREIASFVESRGVPDAVLLRFSPTGQVQWFSLFYKEPPGTVVFKRTLADIDWLSITELEESRKIKELDAVPRTVLRLVFGYGTLPPPWNVTIPEDLSAAFGVPDFPGPPPANQEEPGSVLERFQKMAVSIRNAIKELPAGNASRVRAEKAFKRVVEGVTIPGVSWSLCVFDAQAPVAFGVPDGTVFLSGGLVSALTDDEITAVIAHVVGHEVYGHGRHLVEKARTIGLVLLAVDVIPSLLQYRAPSAQVEIFFYGGYPALLTHPLLGYSESDEMEADRAAADILRKLGIPPDALFDAFAKFLRWKRVEGSTTIDNVHRLDRSVYDLGVLLDSGEIR